MSFLPDIKLEKKFLYDWMGSNDWLFHKINHLSGDPTYNSFMVFLSELGDYRNFHFLMAVLLAFAIGEFLLKKIMRRGGATQTLVLWLGVLVVMVASHVATMLAANHVKKEFHYPRPYVALAHEDVKLLMAPKGGDDDFASFPSGHAANAASIATAIWPILAPNALIVTAGLVFGVCWSRIAVGMHFPADVLAGFLIGFFITLISRWVIYTLMRKIFGLKC